MRRFQIAFAIGVALSVALYGAALWFGWEPPATSHDVDWASGRPHIVAR